MIARRAPIQRRTPLRPSQQLIQRKRANRGKRRTFKLPQDQTHRQRVVIANELWRHRIYAKEPSGICPRCFTRRWHDAAHCFTKGAYPGMRFDLDNGAPLCRACHRRVDSDHQAKVLFFYHYLGAERYARLELMSQARGKTDVALVILQLRAETP